MYRNSFSILFILICSGSCVFAQNNLHERISVDMCECLTKLNRIQNVSYPNLKNCLKNSMQNNITLIYDEVKKEYGDSANYQKGVAYGEKLGRHIDTAMVYSCDTYFRLTDSLRFAYFNFYNKDSVSLLLSKMNDRNDRSSSGFFLERARLNFLVGKYKESLNDIDESSKDPNNRNTLLIVKALCFDKTGKYLEAASIFYKVASLSQESSYLVSAAIENRKLKESK